MIISFFMELFEEKKELLLKSIERLDSVERYILAYRFGIARTGVEVTLEEIGNKLGVSIERVRQIEVSALKKIKDYFKLNEIFLDV